MINYDVYRGPGNEILAISTDPQQDQWLVKRGTQGKRLKTSRWSLEKTPTRKALKGEILSPEYVYLFRGRIDAHGHSTMIVDADVIFWELKDVFVDRLRHDLSKVWKALKDAGVRVSLTDDAIGLVLSGPGWQFGVTARPTPNCVAAQAGSGGGEIVLSQNPELLAVLCVLSVDHPVKFSDAKHNVLNVSQALDTGSRFIQGALVDFLKERGLAPLSVVIKAANRPHVAF